jgi:hypothetical protein
MVPESLAHYRTALVMLILATRLLDDLTSDLMLWHDLRYGQRQVSFAPQSGSREKAILGRMDPIGVNSLDGPQDEYDAYADRAYVMLTLEGGLPMRSVTTSTGSAASTWALVRGKVYRTWLLR